MHESLVNGSGLVLALDCNPRMPETFVPLARFVDDYTDHLHTHWPTFPKLTDRMAVEDVRQLQYLYIAKMEIYHYVKVQMPPEVLVSTEQGVALQMAIYDLARRHVDEHHPRVEGDGSRGSSLLRMIAIDTAEQDACPPGPITSIGGEVILRTVRGVLGFNGNAASNDT